MSFLLGPKQEILRLTSRFLPVLVNKLAMTAKRAFYESLS